MMSTHDGETTALPAEPIARLSEVTFRYSARSSSPPVLEDVTLDIGPRDFLGVIGPNGAGKTTLLKLVLGLLHPQTGSVTVLGRHPAAVRPQIGYVPQHANIDPTVPANVLDVVLMGRLSRSSWGARYGREDREAAMDALRRTHAEHLARRHIGSLSGGERQRVLVARALASDARLLLLDEPTAGVDEHMERGMINLLHQLNERLPIVTVSHDVSFVSRHLKRVACLNRRLTVHAAAELSQDVISEMYHDHLSAIQHLDQCPLSDPGCDWEHQQSHADDSDVDSLQ